MLIGYARVSTLDQNLDRQNDALKAAGCERIYTDKMTGTKANRPGLDKLLDTLRAGDIVVIAELSRLGRSTRDLFALVDRIQDAGAHIKSLKENIDTTTPTGRLFFTMLAGLAQFERDLLSERTKDGLTAARARGRKGGRPLKYAPQEIARALSLYQAGQHTVRQIEELTGVSKAKLYRALNSRAV